MDLTSPLTMFLILGFSWNEKVLSHTHTTDMAMYMQLRLGYVNSNPGGYVSRDTQWAAGKQEQKYCTPTAINHIYVKA